MKNSPGVRLITIIVATLFIWGLIFSPAFGDVPQGLNAPSGNEDLQEEIIRLSAAGRRFNLPVQKNSQGDMFVPLNNMVTGQLMNHFNCRVTYLVPMKTIVLGFRNRRDSRIKLNEISGTFDGKTLPMRNAPFLLDGEPMIPMEALEYAWKVKTGYNEISRVHYMDPVITSVSIEEVKGIPKIVLEATGPVTYETSILRDPLRYVIDVPGAVLDEGLENKDLSHRRVGSMFVSHQSRNPNIVRVIIPLDRGIEVEMVGEPEKPYSVEAWLYSPQVVAPVQDLKQERISDLRVEKKSDRVVFTIMTTGPVQYEWRRLLPPDNRYFVDIPNTLYTAADFEEAFDVGYLDRIRVVQHRPMPDPVVRVTFELHVPSRINVAPNPRYPQEIQVEVFPETINPRRVQRQGFGVTQHAAARGVIICIDPGHGGGDPGAVNRAFGLLEKDLTLDISLRLARMLQKAGWNVVMTRNTDRDVSFAGSSDARELGDRVRIANQTNAQIFVSVHIDASTNPNVSGCSTYYSRPDSADLAAHVQDNLHRAVGLRNIGVRRQSFYVISRTTMPAILVECAFISNPYDAAKLREPSFRQKAAAGIFQGLMQYAHSRNMTIAAPPSDDGSEIIEQKRQAIIEKIEQSEPVGSDSYSER